MTPRTVTIHERFLRHIWSNQYLRRAALKTTDGRSIRVIDVGTPNSDAGPDFRNARMRIGSTMYCGDVEIHRTAIEWLQHQHHDDPRYNAVILHVVLERLGGELPITVFSGRAVPILVLEPYLSDSIRTLWQKAILDERTRATFSIKCFRFNDDVSPQLLTNWLRRLSVERLELKLRRFDERLRELAYLAVLNIREHPHLYRATRVQGNPDDIPPPIRELTQRDLSQKGLWEQALYEGLMECLGYSKNQEPFARLARGATLQEFHTRRFGQNELQIQAFLFGAAGLLPRIRSLEEKESRDFVRGLATEWKSIRKAYRSTILHGADWLFFPTRPTNFPTIRLAAASVLIRRLLVDDLFRKIIQGVKAPRESAGTLAELRALLSVGLLEFWSRHYRFDEPTVRPVRALGIERIDDMIVNVIVPLSLLYARIFKDPAAREGALRLYKSLAPSADNSVTRLMSRQLLKGRVHLDSVGAQQGVIQLYKYYCRVERCVECEVGEVVFRSAK